MIDERETRAPLRELRASAAQAAADARIVAELAAGTLGAAQLGEQAIWTVVEGMEKVQADAARVGEALDALLARLERIGGVVAVIDDVADRSDLLAINAALEAAHVGEGGTGFAIVAEEMRRHAGRTFAGTAEIRGLVAEIAAAAAAARAASIACLAGAREGERLGAEAMASVHGVLSRVQETTAAARSIQDAADRQLEATSQAIEDLTVAHGPRPDTSPTA